MSYIYHIHIISMLVISSSYFHSRRFQWSLVFDFFDEDARLAAARF